MRHAKAGRRFDMPTSQRLHMFRTITQAVIRDGGVQTTQARAKEVQPMVDKMITLGKRPSLANRRLAFDRLRDRDIVTKLFNDLGKRFSTRPGGYTRILKMGFRVGDNAPMAFVELVDRPEEAAAAGEAAE